MSETILHPDQNDQDNETKKTKGIILPDPLFDQLPDTASDMWEIPQIYEFLCLAKDTLRLQNLSMYEMERMLLIPKASKQLAHVMTSLLSPSLPVSKFKTIPPMDYDFWTNYLLTYKIPSWFKIYESKDKDSVKVLDVIGIEPEFWKIFPDTTSIEDRNFEEFELREKVWILKTICDTLMHTKRTLQEEVANKYLDGQSEKILGRDRYGARYIYFPIFLDGDLRVYKHFMNNKTFLNAVPASAKLKLQTTTVRQKKSERRTWKTKRWRNGALPSKSKKKIKKPIKKILESTKNDGIEKNNTQELFNNLNATDMNKDVELNKDLMGAECKEAIMDIIGIKPCTIDDTDTHQHLDEISNSSKTDDEKINEIMSSGSVVPVKSNSEVSKSDDEKLIETKTVDCDLSSEMTDKMDDSTELKHAVEEDSPITRITDSEKTQNNNGEISQTNLIENEGIKTRSKVICKNEMSNFNNILTDLKVSKFQLVADSVESLRTLNFNLSRQNAVKSNEAGRCELLLLRKLKTLIQLLESKESYLKGSTERAKEKLQSEWTAFKRGYEFFDSGYIRNIKDTEKKSLDVHDNSNSLMWILGSQGCPLLTSSDTTQQRQSEEENDHEKSESREEDEQHDEREDNDFKDGKSENRRVLRTRGVSSYIEQFSTDDDSDSSQPVDWVGFETIDPATGIHITPVIPPQLTPTKPRSNAESDATDSDKDWILPSSRKRKKRFSSSKRIKTLQHKVHLINDDLHMGHMLDENMRSSTAANIESTINDNSIDKNDNCNRALNSLNNIKIESVHSILDIKDEGPILDSQLLNENVTSRVPQNYVLVNNGNGPVNYVVMKQENPSITQASPVISVVPQVPIHGSPYYIKNNQGYLVSNPQITNVQSSYTEPSSMPPMIMQHNQNYVSSPNNYMQYQQLGLMPPGNMCSNPYPGPVPRTPVTLSMQTPRALPRVVQNRPVILPPRPRHPEGAVIRSSIVPFRGNIRQAAPRPRLPAPRTPNALRYVRPVRPQAPNNVIQPRPKFTNTNKPTSLIVLSDDDDEIEMIIPEKSSATPVKNTIPADKRVVNRSKPANSTALDTLSDKGGLSPQIIERMNQGGISITPVKRKSPEKQQPISATQLVVVVNETGSHYALSLPNGSKLILTPEQVAQIRASNGGKLIL